VKVMGDVLLDKGFIAQGEVALTSAQIGGNLACGGGTFKNPEQKNLPKTGRALTADGANVAGGVYLDKDFTAQGQVRLPGAQIGGDLDCGCGRFESGTTVGQAGTSETQTLWKILSSAISKNRAITIEVPTDLRALQSYFAFSREVLF
jgi:hypothetical protein